MARMPGVLALHQPVQPQRLAVVHQIDLVALPGHHVLLPGPRALARHDALRQRASARGLRRAEREFPRDCGYLCGRELTTPLQQPVHGLAGAG